MCFHGFCAFLLFFGCLFVFLWGVKLGNLLDIFWVFCYNKAVEIVFFSYGGNVAGSEKKLEFFVLPRYNRYFSDYPPGDGKKQAYYT